MICHCYYQALLHHTVLSCTKLSYYAPFESYAASFWAILWTLSSYTAPYWAELHLPEISSALRAMLYPTDQCCIHLSFAATFWATLEPSKLLSSIWAMLRPTEQCCILTKFAASYWTTLHPFELCCILLSCYEPSGLRYTLLSQAELRCTLLNYVYTAPSKLRCTLTELPPFIQFYRMPECRTFLHPISPVPEWKEVPMPKLDSCLHVIWS